MRKASLISFVLLFAAGMVLVACSGAADNTGDSGTADSGKSEESGESGPDKGEEAGGDITLAYVSWDSDVASHYVLQKVLEDQGFSVELLDVGSTPMWAGVADGSADASAAAWLPTTHKAQYEKYGDQLDDLGPNLEGVKIGLVVPDYVDIDSIEELNDHADKTGGQIVGIEANTGVMSAAEDAIDEYGMNDMELLASSSAGMTSELQRAYDAEEWVVVTGWTPHWQFSKFDLKYLDDPKDVFGGEEAIHTIARKGLEEDMPKAYEILHNFHWETADMEEVMLKIEEGANPKDAAAEWVEDNQDKVKEWIGE